MLVIPPRSDIRARPLYTARLALTPVDPDDAPELWTVIEGSRVHLEKWLPWVPFSSDPAANLRFTEACATDWDNGRALRFTMRERQRGERIVGIVGLEACVHLHRSCELGYWLRRDATRLGLMTEGARAVIGFGFHHMGAHRIRVAAATDNDASLAVIARLGFRFEGVARQAEYCDRRWLDHAVFAMLATDYTGDASGSNTPPKP